MQPRKKPRQKAEPLDEETMVALALSSSLVEQRKESRRASPAEAVVSSLVSAAPELKWRPGAGTYYCHFITTFCRRQWDVSSEAFDISRWTITV